MVAEVTQDVFELVVARAVLAAGAEHSWLVHLWWRAPEQGERVVQVYVDGELVDVVGWLEERETWLVLDRARKHRIELLAVATENGTEVWKAYPRALGSWQPAVAGEVEITLLRDERLAADTTVSVGVDGAELDEGLMWSAVDHRGGFGALFGVGSFGQDDATGVGLGAGELGMGLLGADGTAWRWRRRDVGEGGHAMTVEARADSGVMVADTLSLTQEVQALPGEAVGFGIDSGYIASWGG